MSSLSRWATQPQNCEPALEMPSAAVVAVAVLSPQVTFVTVGDAAESASAW